MFENCFTYNEPGSVVYADGVKLQQDFESRFSETFLSTKPKRPIIEDSDEGKSILKGLILESSDYWPFLRLDVGPSTKVRLTIGSRNH